MTRPTFRSVLLWLVPALAVSAPHALLHQDPPAPEAQEPEEEEKAVQVQYLEIVTPEVDATCAALEKMHGVTFTKPIAALANARTAPLAGGGKIGVRAPGHPAEKPVVRPYVQVSDIDAAFEVAKAAETEILHPPFEIPGICKFAIYELGGIEHALWQD